MSRIFRSRIQVLLSLILSLALLLSPFAPFQNSKAEAAFNKQINYQGKLSDSSNATVANGSYSIRFKLYTVPAGGSPVWTEVWCKGTACDGGAGTDSRIPLVSGLFSTMLGSTTPLTSVDFNQTLYLGVEIGGSAASSTWDGEMTPRKILGAVPAAFEAGKLGGAESWQFLRSDVANSTSTAGTFLSVTQSGAGAVADFRGPSGSLFTVLSGGNIGIGTSSPAYKVDIKSGSIALDNLNGLVFRNTAGAYLGQFYYDNTNAFAWVTNGSQQMVLDSSGRLGIGTTSPYAKLSVKGAGSTTGVNFQTTNSSDVPLFSILDNGNTGVGSTSPNWKLSVAGIGSFDNNVRASYFAATSTATSTFVGGVNVATGAGCLAVNGNCVSTGSGTVNAGTTGQLPFYAANGTALTATSSIFLTTNGNVTIGTTTPGFSDSVLTIDRGRTANGDNYGIYVNSKGTNGNGTQFGGYFNLQGNGSGNSYGVYAISVTNGSDSSYGVYGDGADYGVFGNGTIGVYGQSTASGGSGVYASQTNVNGYGLTSIAAQNYFSGKVGIGTTSPYAALSVAGATGVVAQKFTATSTTATSTFAGGVAAAYLSLTGTSATSTAASGLNLSAGCFSVNNVCVGGSSNSVGAGTIGQFPYYAANGSTLSATSSIYIDPTGLIAIGTTTPNGIVSGPTNLNPGVLELARQLIFSRGAGGSIGVAQALSSQPATPLVISAGAGPNGESTIGGRLTLRGGTSDLGLGGDVYINGGVSNDSPSEYGNVILAPTAGNVGVGDVTPAALFTVGNGDLFQINTSGLIFTPNGSASAPSKSFVSDPNTGTFGTGADVWAVATAGLERFRIDATGNVGIGTSSPFSKLSVVGQVVAANYIATTTATSTFTGGLATAYLSLTGTTATSTAANGINLTNGCFSINSTCVGGSSNSVGASTAIGQFPYYAAVGSTLTATSSIFLVTNGYVGIGTTTPTNRLTVTGDVDPAADYDTNGQFAIRGATNPFKVLMLGVDTATTTNYAYIQSSQDNTATRALSLNPIGGNVGVGTTSPNWKFSVAGIGSFDSNVRASFFTATSTTATSTFGGVQGTYLSLTGTAATSTAASGINLTAGCFSLNNTCVGNQWGISGSNIYYTTGSVGIGLSSTPSAKLHVQSTADDIAYFDGVTHALVTINGASTAEKSLNFDTGGALNWKIGIDDVPSGNNADFTIKRSNNGTPDFVILNSNGRVGLNGITAPTANLEITGGGLHANPVFSVAGAGDVVLATQGSLFFDGNFSYNSGSYIGPYSNTSGTYDANTFKVTTGGTERMRITSGGNLGIGDISPAAMLTVGNGDLFQVNSSGLLFTPNGTASAPSHSFVSDPNTGTFGTGSDVWAVATAGLERLRIDANGNVGIGTSSPYAVLSVAGASGIVAAKYTATTTATSTFAGGVNVATNGGCLAVNGTCVSTSSGSGTVNSGTTGQLPYYAGSGTTLTATSTLFLATTGNVGVGTTSPATTFSVAGNGYFTGGLGVGVVNTVANTFQVGQCVTGDTLLRRRRKKFRKEAKKTGGAGDDNEDEEEAPASLCGSEFESIRIDEIGEGDTIMTLDDECGVLVGSNVKQLAYMGEMPIVKLGTESGKSIRTTMNHPYLVHVRGKRTGAPSLKNGGVWKPVANLKEGQYIAAVNGSGEAFWDKIVTLESLPAEDVWDVEVEGTRNFIGNDIVAHNTSFLVDATGNVGVGTTSPYAKLSVTGQIVGAYFTSTTTATSTFGGPVRTASCFTVNDIRALTLVGSSGTENVLLGTSGNTAMSGTSNILVGGNTGRSMTSGCNNTAFGQEALCSNTTGSNNTASGYRTLFSNTSGCYNVAFGNSALFCNTSGCNNFASGFAALSSNLTGCSNTAFGFGSLNQNQTGCNNTAAGLYALKTNCTGSNNIAFGLCAARNATSSNNIAFGLCALASNANCGTGDNNFVAGNTAMTNNCTGSNNTVFGYQAMCANTTGSYNTVSGYAAMQRNTTGSSNTAFGYQAMVCNTTGRDNTAIGECALRFNVTGAANIAIGQRAMGGCVTSGNANISLGTFSLYRNTSGCANVALGQAVLNSNTTGFNNTAAGWYALGNSVTGNNNTAFGFFAGNNTFSSNNTFIGFCSGVANVNGSSNFFEGCLSGAANTTGATSTFIGPLAGCGNTTGNENIFIGDCAGCANVTGCNSIALGYGASVGTSNNYALAEGNLSFATGSSSTASGYRNCATATSSSAFGYLNSATGSSTVAIGKLNSAPAVNAVALGNSNFTGTAGFASVAMGLLNNQTGATLVNGTGIITGTPSALTVGFTSSAVGISNNTTANCAAAFGNNNNASGVQAAAYGVSNSSSGSQTTAFGYLNSSGCNGSTAFGFCNCASSCASVAFGANNTSSGPSTSAFGFRNSASGYSTTASGYCNTALCTNAAAVGYRNRSASTSAAAIGILNCALGNTASAFGYSNTASSTGASAFGYCNLATCVTATAFGYCNLATGLTTTAFGYCNLSTVAGSGAFGFCNSSSGTNSSAMGNHNSASGYLSSASGHNNNAGGTNASAFGDGNTAANSYSSAFGVGNTSNNFYSSAFGYGNSACCDRASAFGYCNTASGCYSSAFGFNLNTNACFASVYGSNITNSTGCSVEIGISNTDKLQIGTNSVNFLTGGGQICINGTPISGGGGPAGSNCYVQFNNGGSFGADSCFYFDCGNHCLYSSIGAFCTLCTTSAFINTQCGSCGSICDYCYINAAENHCNQIGTDSYTYLHGDGSAITNISDKTKKQNFVALDKSDLLSKIDAMTIEQWSYKTSPGINHVGPYAQDFYSAFGLGTGSTTISAIDTPGIALAGVQAVSLKLNAFSASTTDSVLALGARLDDIANVGSSTPENTSPFLAALFRAFENFGIKIEDKVASFVAIVTDKLTAHQIYASEIKADVVKTTKLCIDELCLTKEQFQTLLQKNGMADTPDNGTPPADSPTPPEESGTSTDPVAGNPAPETPPADNSTMDGGSVASPEGGGTAVAPDDAPSAEGNQPTPDTPAPLAGEPVAGQ